MSVDGLAPLSSRASAGSVITKVVVLYDIYDIWTWALRRHVFAIERIFMMTSSNGNNFSLTGPLCGEFPGPRWIPRTKTVTRSFDVFFDLRPNKRLSKQPWGWWFETPSWSLWRQCNNIMLPWINEPDSPYNWLMQETGQVTSMCWYLVPWRRCPSLLIKSRSSVCSQSSMFTFMLVWRGMLAVTVDPKPGLRTLLVVDLIIRARPLQKYFPNFLHSLGRVANLIIRTYWLHQ